MYLAVITNQIAIYYRKIYHFSSHHRSLLNTFMKNLNALEEHNLRIDAELLENLKQLGIVQTQYELSRLCGMNESYYSSMRTKGYGIKLGSLVFLLTELAKRSRETKEPKVGAVLTHALSIVQNAIQEKCHLRELTLKATGGR